MRDPDPLVLRLLTDIARQEDHTGHASLGSAARRLRMQQPNASRLLARFEAQTGVRVVQRSPGGSSLTADGQALVTWAEPVVDGYDRIDATLTALRRQTAATVRIAASLTVAEYVLPPYLLRFRREQRALARGLSGAGRTLAHTSLPGTEHGDGGSLEPRVALEMMNSAAVLDQVRGGRVDLGFIETVGRPRGVRYRTIGHDELVIAALPDHPAAAGPPMSAEMLGTIPLLVRERGSGTRQAVDRAVSGGATVAAEFTSASAIKTALATGAAPAAISRLAVREQLRTGTFVALPVENDVAARLGRSLRVVWAVGERPRGAAAEFVRLVTTPGP